MLLWNSIILLISALTAFFAAGLADGTADRLQFRLPAQLRGDSFWDPKISWRNKWKNGDPAQGERFPGSSTIFVFLTDAWHLAKFSRNTAYLAATAAALAAPPDWKMTLITLCLAVIARGAGFTITWNIKHRRP